MVIKHLYFCFVTLETASRRYVKLNGCVYIQIVKHCSADELLPIIRDLSDISETEFYSATSYNDWAAYDGLVDYDAKAHYRVKHSKNEFALDRNHINRIENFLRLC